MPTANAIDLTTTVVQVATPLASEIDDEVLLLDIRTEKYYGMDAVGARIWQLLAQPCQLAVLCRQLMTEFDVDRSTCEEDVQQFVQRLYDAELVHTISK